MFVIVLKGMQSIRWCVRTFQHNPNQSGRLILIVLYRFKLIESVKTFF